MRHFTFLILLSFALLFNSYAEKVNRVDAEKIAINLLMSKSKLKTDNAFPINLVHVEYLKGLKDNAGLKSEEATPLYYVFAGPNSNGFVIVSGDDNVVPILGYSLSSSISFEGPQPPALTALLESYARQIQFVVENNVVAGAPVKESWKAFQSSSEKMDASAIVGPLIQTEWNQGCNYNYYCPEDSNSGSCERALVGCVAVAMAQIMKYWNHPETCNEIPGYNHADYGFISSLSASTFQWDQMANTLSSDYGPPNIPPVAEILYYAGVSVQMDYGSSSSGAYSSDAATAFVDYFKYSSSLQYIAKDNYYSDSEWRSLLKNELDNGRPVYYAGSGDVGGHAFVCDGYDSDNKFHINWGWGGSRDGYFQLTALNPTSNYSFNENNRAIIGIEPASSSGTDDIYIENQGLSQYSACPGESIVVSCDQVYSGTTMDADMPSPDLGYYLSSDRNWDSSDIYLDYDTSSLGSDDPRHTESETVTIPSDTQEGTWYILFVADYEDEIAETNEGNNVAYSEINLSCSGQDDDVYIENQGITQTSVCPGASIDVSCDQVYSGSTLNGNLPNPDVGYYLSSNTSWESSDILLSYDSSSLGSDDTRDGESESLTIPSDTEEGTWYILFVGDYEDEIGETDEENNVAYAEITLFCKRDDLSIENQGVSQSTVCPGASIDLSCDQVYSGNTPDADLADPKVGYYLSSNTSFESTDVLLGYDISALGSDVTREAESEVVTIPSDAPEGTWYILFVADYENSIGETDEGNNTVYSEITLNCTYGDVTIENQGSPQARVCPGESIELSCEQVYTGTHSDADLADSNVGYYLSSNTSFESTDIFLGYDTSALGSDATWETESESVVIPSDTPEGNWYILYVADYENAIKESDEGNNVAYSEVLLSCTNDDFSIENQGVSQSTVCPGASIDVSCDQVYSGNTLDDNLTDPYVGYYLSSNTSFESSDVYLGTDSSPLGSDNTRAAELESVMIPSETPEGTWYILFVADYDNATSETNEGNNVAYSEITVYCTYGDIIIENQGVSQSTICPGSTIDLTCDQVYSGSTLDINLVDPNVGYYLSSNTSFDSSDIYLSYDVSSIGSDDTWDTETERVKIPSDTPEGTWYILFVADHRYVINETDEGNNVAYSEIRVACRISPPGGVTASQGEYQDKIVVSWDAVSGATDYRVYRSVTPDTLDAAAISEWQSTTSFEDTNVSKGDQFYYWVKSSVAQSAESESYYSESAIGFVSANNLPAKPRLVFPEMASTVRTSPVVFNWEGSDLDGDALSYELWVIYPGGEEVIMTQEITELEYSFVPDRDGDYVWFVKATDGYDTTQGNNWIFTYKENTQPSVATKPLPADGAEGVEVSGSLLSWECTDEDGDPIFYDVWFGTDENALEVFPVDVNSYELPQLDYNTTYYWKVYSYNEGGDKTEGELWSFTTAEKVLEVPMLTSPEKEAVGVSIAPTISWDYDLEGEENITFKVLVGEQEDNLVEVGQTQSLNYLLENSSLGTLEYEYTYFWAIVATDGELDSEGSEVWSFTTESDALEVPTLASPENGTTDVSIAPTLSWQCEIEQNEKITYRVLVGEQMDVLKEVGQTQELNFRIEGSSKGALQYGKTYFWAIITNNGEKDSERSEVWSFTTEQKVLDIPMLSSPENNTLAVSIAPTLAWEYQQEKADIIFKVLLGTKENDLQEVGQTQELNFPMESSALETLQYGQSYFWAIVASDGEVDSQRSEVWNFTTKEYNALPEKPILIAPEATSTVRNASVVLKWDCTDPEGDELSFDLYLQYPDGTGSALAENMKKKEYTLDLKQEGKYEWWVVASEGKNQTQGENWTFTYKVNTQPSMAQNPYPAKGAEGIKVDLAALTWECSDEDEDSVYYDVKFGANMYRMDEYSVESTSFDLDALEYNTTYYWKVYSYNLDGEKIEGPLWQFTTEGPTGIDDLASYGLEIYPNPVTEFLTISFSDYNVGIQIQILDDSGKLVYSDRMPSPSTRKINFSGYANGIYILRILLEEKVITHKIILVK